MSNKRIQKKRAKAQWERDKSKLIANFLVWMDPTLTNEEYIQQAALLWNLDKEMLFRQIDEMMTYQLRYQSPFRMMRKADG